MKSKIFSLLFFIFLIVMGGSGQENKPAGKETKQQTKQQKKAEREARMNRQFLETGKLLENRRFVLQANYLLNNLGQRRAVTSELNFIAVDSLYSMIQIGSMQGVGFNGVGGITAEGKVSNWKMDKNEKAKNYDIFMTVNSNLGFYDITVSVDYSGHAGAELTGIRAGRLQFEGDIVPKDSTRIYKGRTY